ncbi:MAG: hypothetical protein ACYC96_06330 [Fimbriimonadaceae bacterium]
MPTGRGLTAEQLAEIERSGREADVKVALLKLGVGRAQILELVAQYPLEVIEQQLAWLPLRKPRKPSSLIVSAIRESYEAPAAAFEPTAADSSSSVYRETDE